MSEPSVLRSLLAEPQRFDFFQACRLLGRVQGGLHREGIGPAEPARFRGRVSLAFPASAIHALTPPDVKDGMPVPAVMTVTFLGLYGTTGVLPRHYTHELMELETGPPERLKTKLDKLSAEYKEEFRRQRTAMRDWLDLFNHRWVWLFYRAWEKYRFWLPYERGEPLRDDPDPFTRALLAVCGLATGGLRNRVRVSLPAAEPADPLAVVHDLGLLRYAGLLAQRRRSPWGLGVLLAGYFEVPVAVVPFSGQWLPLDPASRTRLGAANAVLGREAVAGERVYDVQGKYRLRLGPLTYPQFLEYLPDRRPEAARKAFFLVCQLAKLYAGPEFDLDVQLVLRADQVPAARLTADEGTGPRLGWNCWLLSGPAKQDAGEAVFAGQPVTVLG